MNVLRIIDASANRAREALRVMEDAARFLLDDRGLTRELKKLRHDFAAAIRLIDGVELQRDTVGDVGTSVSTKSERTRGSVSDVVVAAGKRLSESLRSLEEFGKLVNTEFAGRIEQLRYRGYTLEKRLHEALPPEVRQWRVCVIVTEAMCTFRGWVDVVKASLDGGADCIQLREKSLEGGEWLRRAEQMVKLAEGRADVIVNDRPDIALLSGAKGVHVGEFDLPPRRLRATFGRRLVIGASTHNLREAAAAVKAGADYCGVGAIFPTTTKQRTPSGLKYLREFVAKFPGVVHLAIGGISTGNVEQVVEAGGRGVAVSSVVCGAKSPRKVVEQLVRAMGKRRTSPPAK
jgi:thiamine-phosphate pyrophosphorylase